jgi:hypothetical protein
VGVDGGKQREREHETIDEKRGKDEYEKERKSESRSVRRRHSALVDARLLMLACPSLASAQTMGALPDSLWIDCGVAHAM